MSNTVSKKSVLLDIVEYVLRLSDKAPSLLEDSIIKQKDVVHRVLNALGYEYLKFDRVNSTQDVAKDVLKSGIQKAVIRAEIQILGRGRNNRVWYSPKGGLWMTILDQDVQHPNILVPAAIAVLLRRYYVINAYIKLPNDIYVDKKKLCGVLIESMTTGSKTYYVIGIGLNVNNDPPIDNAISLKNLLNKSIDLEELLLGIITYYELIKHVKNYVVLFKRMCKSINAWNIITKYNGEKIRIKVLDVNLDGFIIGEDETGRIIKLHSSEIKNVRLEL